MERAKIVSKLAHITPTRILIKKQRLDLNKKKSDKASSF